MAVGIMILYLLTLASFAPPFLLAGYLWLQGQSPLAATFLRFQAAYLGFLAALFAAFLGLQFMQGQAWRVEVAFNTLFFVLYAVLVRQLTRLVFELLQRTWTGRWRRAVDALAWGGIALPLLLHALVFDGVERALALRLWLNGVYFVAFLLTLVVVFLVAVRGWKTLSDPWKRGTLGGACLIFFGSIPLFVIDAFWPVLQVNGSIPRGLNLQLATTLAWNVFFTVRWFSFPVHDKPVVEGEPSPRMLEVLTGREREIARLILAGRSNQDISTALGVTLSTTKNHVYNIFNKTGASSRKELCRMLVAP